MNELLTTNWFNISYDLAYQEDTFAEMSEGKQAFVILKLLIDFSTKKCPILIDQPEDSLDNRAIYNELIKYLKAKKKERQIILVTHNPNDSIPIILESQGIREDVFFEGGGDPDFGACCPLLQFEHQALTSLIHRFIHYFGGC